MIVLCSSMMMLSPCSYGRRDSMVHPIDEWLYDEFDSLDGSVEALTLLHPAVGLRRYKRLPEHNDNINT